MTREEKVLKEFKDGVLEKMSEYKLDKKLYPLVANLVLVKNASLAKVIDLELGLKEQ